MSCASSAKVAPCGPWPPANAEALAYEQAEAKDFFQSERGRSNAPALCRGASDAEHRGGHWRGGGVAAGGLSPRPRIRRTKGGVVQCPKACLRASPVTESRSQNGGYGVRGSVLTSPGARGKSNTGGERRRESR